MPEKASAKPLHFMDKTDLKGKRKKKKENAKNEKRKSAKPKYCPFCFSFGHQKRSRVWGSAPYALT